MKLMTGTYRIFIGFLLVLISFTPPLATLFGSGASTFSVESIQMLMKWSLGFGAAGLFIIATGTDKMESKYRELRTFILTRHDPRILKEFDNENDS